MQELQIYAGLQVFYDFLCNFRDFRLSKRADILYLVGLYSIFHNPRFPEAVCTGKSNTFSERLYLLPYGSVGVREKI